MLFWRSSAVRETEMPRRRSASGNWRRRSAGVEVARGGVSTRATAAGRAARGAALALAPPVFFAGRFPGAAALRAGVAFFAGVFAFFTVFAVLAMEPSSLGG